MRFRVGFAVGFAALISLLMGSPADACQYDRQIKRVASLHGVNPKLAMAICHAESSGDPKTVGSAGERGLFQIAPATWREYTGLPFWLAFNPSVNIQVGLQHLAKAGTDDPRELVAWHNAGKKTWWKLSRRWTVKHPNNIYRTIYKTGRIPQEIS